MRIARPQVVGPQFAPARPNVGNFIDDEPTPRNKMPPCSSLPSRTRLGATDTLIRSQGVNDASFREDTRRSQRRRARNDARRCERDIADAEAAEHRHADDRRYRLERFRRLFRRRQGARPSDAERRQDRRGRRDLHQLVRAGELHRGPRLVHDRAHPDPLGAVDRRRAGRPELPAQGNADHRRVLPEERLFDLFLRQMASRRQARILSDRARLRRDEELRRLLRRRLCLRRHQQVVPSLVPVLQSDSSRNTSART